MPYERAVENDRIFLAFAIKPQTVFVLIIYCGLNVERELFDIHLQIAIQQLQISFLIIESNDRLFLEAEIVCDGSQNHLHEIAVESHGVRTVI